MLDAGWRGPGRPRLSDEQKRLRGTDRRDRYPGSRAILEPAWTPRKRDFAGLSPRAQAFMHRVVARTAHRGLELTPKGGRLLVRLAWEIDELDVLRDEVKREGLQVAGSRGRLKQNPRARELWRRDRCLDKFCRHFDVPRPGQ